MRVLHLTRDFPPRYNGGISTAVGGLARASAASGTAIAVISFDDWRPRRRATPTRPAEPRCEDGIEVMRLTSPTQLDAARAFAAAQRADVVHVHHAMLWALAAELRARLGAPALLTVHVLQRRMNELRGTSERTLSLAAEEAALAAADRIIAPSNAAAAALTGVDRVCIAPHGIDPPVEGIPLGLPCAERGGLQFLAVGRFDDVKGTPELFEAIPRILSSLPEATFTVAGGLPANRRAERRWVAQWERTAREDIRVRTRITGWLRPDELARWYGTADVVVVPSRFETFGLVALEAMRHGLPVAATAAGGVAELVVDGETGLLSPVGDAAMLSANAIALGRDPALRHRLGNAAAARVRREWRWERRLPAILALYRDVM